MNELDPQVVLEGCQAALQLTTQNQMQSFVIEGALGCDQLRPYLYIGLFPEEKGLPVYRALRTVANPEFSNKPVDTMQNYREIMKLELPDRIKRLRIPNELAVSNITEIVLARDYIPSVTLMRALSRGSLVSVMLAAGGISPERALFMLKSYIQSRRDAMN